MSKSCAELQADLDYQQQTVRPGRLLSQQYTAQQLAYWQQMYQMLSNVITNMNAMQSACVRNLRDSAAVNYTQPPAYYADEETGNTELVGIETQLANAQADQNNAQNNAECFGGQYQQATCDLAACDAEIASIQNQMIAQGC